MCGIITASGSIPFSVDKLNLLFAYNESRGKDSVGFYNEDNKIPFENRLYKKMGRASSELIPTHRWKETNLFLGHVRAATKGIVNIQNCHPFLFDNIIGCHNGTLDNWGLLKKEHDLSDKVDMDSKVFFDYLNTYPDYKILEEFEGAANVLWVDKRDPKKLFVFKHKDRTLFRGMIETEKGKIMYISSVETGLEAIGCKSIKPFKNQYLYEIVDGVIIKTIKIKSTPRKALSIQRQKDLGIYKEPNKITETSISSRESTEDFLLAEVISTQQSSYLSESTNNSLNTKEKIQKVAWVTEKLSDLTEYYYPKKLELSSTENFHPIISHKEIVYNDLCDTYILNVYFNSGAFYEFNLGLPGIHYEAKGGKKLSSLLISEQEESEYITDEIADCIIETGNMLEDLLEDLKYILQSIETVVGKESIVVQKIETLINNTEEYTMNSELLMSKIIENYVDTDFE